MTAPVLIIDSQPQGLPAECRPEYEKLVDDAGTKLGFHAEFRNHDIPDMDSQIANAFPGDPLKQSEVDEALTDAMFKALPE